tara:strand:+ start:476 stop:631 length:156 start_codon:yes stop_codon:yes gene_type:complete
MIEGKERLEILKEQAKKFGNDIPFGLKISIARLENELNPEDSGEDCIACGS